uniref:Uncharacterized protein n=1 Tax=Moorena producens (strain JHB) TaxID=1454205 RepID=A0A1D9FY06_MOOP1
MSGLALPWNLFSTLLVYHKKYYIIAYFEKICNKLVRESGIGSVGGVGSVGGMVIVGGMAIVGGIGRGRRVGL